jgi:hypothetical protein
VQVIKAATPNSAIQQNVAGDDTLGFRVIDDFVGTYVLAEYSIYWHHKSSNACYGDNNWVMAPGEDTVHDTVNPRTPAAGSSDPKDGDFLPPTGDVESTVTVDIAGGTETTVTYTDGSKKVITKTKDGDGTITIRTVYYDADGNIIQDEVQTKTDLAPVQLGGEEMPTSASGRISWEQL